MSQYDVVGCSDCNALWIAESYRTSETATCPCCGTSHATDALKSLFGSEVYEEAAEIRSRILADRAGMEDQYAREDDFGVLADRVAEKFDAEGGLFAEAAEQYLAREEGRFEALARDAGDDEKFAELVDLHPVGADRYAELADAAVERQQQDFHTLVEERLGDIFDQPIPDVHVDGAGLSFATGQSDIRTTVSDVGPRFSEWLAELLDALLPACAETVADLDTTDAFAALVEEAGVTAGHGSYARALVRWAERYSGAEAGDLNDWDEGSQQQTREQLRGMLTTVGMGQTPEAMGREALKTGPIATLGLRETPPSVRVVLDGGAWLSDTDARTEARALEMLGEFAQVVDLELVATPQVRQHLVDTHPDWADEHLTNQWDGSSRPTESDADATAAAWEIVQEWSPKSGRTRLLKNLPETDARPVPELVDDPEIDLRRGSVDRYVSECEAAGLVEVDRRRSNNRVSLNARGRAAQTLITADYRILHPGNATLESHLTETSQSDVGSVYRADRDTGSPPGGAAVEEWLAATGQLDDPAEYVRFIGDDAQIDAYRAHRRLAAGKRVDGVTFVDDRIDAFEDGRVAYLSCFEDHLQAVTQWGGAAPTLVRIAAALSDHKVWGRILSRETVGDHLENLVAEGLSEDDRLDQLQRGSQVGWCSRDELTYTEFRGRLYITGRRLLGRLADLPDMTDEERSRLFCDAHGLLTTMTALLEAVGVDVTIHLRVPDVANIRRDEQRHREFLTFLQRTVPKQTKYGIHSGWRQLFDARQEKLRSRLPIEVDPTDPIAAQTASWVVTGPGAENLMDETKAALSNLEEREAIREGHEETIAMDIPVASGTTFAAIRETVEDVLSSKRFRLDREELTHATRLLMGVLGEGPWHCSPYVVVDALLSLAHSNGTGFGMLDVRNALSTLPAHRLFPELADSAQQMVKALLASDEPLTPTELREEASVSETSYYRHVDALETVGLLVHTEGQWQAAIEPWWAPDSSADRPDRDGLPETDRPWADDMLFELALALEGEQHLADVWTTSASYEEIADAVPDLRPWIPWVVALIDEPPTEETERDVQHAKLGTPPAMADNRQTALREQFA